MSVLKVYKQIEKEYQITEDDTVSPIGKMSYLQTQIQEQRQIANRLHMDLAVATAQMEKAEDPQVKDAHRKKADDYKADLRGILQVIRLNVGFANELRKEYPELGNG